MRTILKMLKSKARDQIQFLSQRKTLACLLGSFLSVFLVCTPAHAYPTIYNIGVPIITQDYPKWCWAACGASTVNYYGGNTSQYMFSFYTKDSIVIEYASVSEVSNGLSHYSLHNHPFAGTMNYATIQGNSYNQGRPALAALIPSSGSNIVGHMVVITGFASLSGGENNVILMDPAYSSYRTITHSALLSNSNYYWGATIDQIY